MMMTVIINGTFQFRMCLIFEFTCSAEDWRRYRMRAFAIALLGCLVFPRARGNIYTRLTFVVQALVHEDANCRIILVPMILAEMMRGLSTCVKGRSFYEGCNLLLQLWAIEYFYKRNNLIDMLNGVGNKISNHSIRMKYFIAPVGTENWLAFLKRLSGCHIQWKYFWLNNLHDIIRGDER